MRKIFVLSILLLILNNVFGESISKEKAINVAINWINSTSNSFFTSKDISYINEKKSNDSTLFYIVAFDPKGWVVVSAIDLVTPVIAYSNESRIDQENIPIQFRDWMEGVSTEIQKASNDKITPDFSARDNWRKFGGRLLAPSELKSVTGISAGPLLTSTWDQGRYYNALCPSDASSSTGNGKVWVGCTATAMAQIMRFWGFPSTGVGSHSYNHSSYGTLTANFGEATYNWGNMPNQLSTENIDVATISYHCAVACNMQFGPYGSGAFLSDARNGYENYFKYNTSAFFSDKDFWDDTQWKALIRSDIDRGRPILYSGYAPDYSSGHAFVLDGYSGEYFHFNWGWSGTANGNFLLSLLNPIGRNYTNDQGAIFGIDPIVPVALSFPYQESFESGSSSLSLSGISGFSTDASHTGSNCVRLSNSTNIYENVNTATLTFIVPESASMSFWVKRQSTYNSPSNQQVAYLLSAYGSTPLYTFFNGDFNDSDWQNFSLNLSSYSGQTVRLVFKQSNRDFTNKQWMYIDDIVISGTSQNLPPFQPSNPQPANASTGVSTAPTLSWSGGDPEGQAVTYSVYYGTQNPPQFATTTTQRQYTTSALNNKTKYYWKIEASDGEMTSTSPVWSFTTMGVPPDVASCGVSDVTSNSAVVCGSVTNDRGSSIDFKGICYSTSMNPTVSNSKIYCDGSNAHFLGTISGLNPYKTYYARAFAISSDGTSYSENMSFNTLPDSPVISAGMVDNIQRSSARIEGSVIAINDQEITERGAVWSTTSGFNISDATVVGDTGNWSSTGKFYINLNNLPGPKVIFYRVFARNSINITYTEEKQFTTLNTVPFIDLDADNSSGVTGNRYNAMAFEQQLGGKICDNDVLLEDPDNDSIQFVKVILTKQLIDEKEYLIVDTTSLPFIVSGNLSDTLLITKNGSVSNSNWAAVLKKVYLFIDEDSPTPSFKREVSVIINDGFDFSSAAIAYFTVIPVNDPPRNSVLPLLLNTPIYGQKVTAHKGTWIDDRDNCSTTFKFRYQWQYASSITSDTSLIFNIPNATDSVFTISDLVASKYIRFKETVIDSTCGGTNVATDNAFSEWVLVQKANQTITKPSFIECTYSKIPVKLTATASSGLPIHYIYPALNIADIVGDSAYLKGVGTLVVTATQLGDDRYNAAENKSFQLIVNRGVQTINFPKIDTSTFDRQFILAHATSTSGLPVSISSSDSSIAEVINDTIFFKGIGVVTLTATQAGNAYIDAAAPVSQALTITRGTQLITFNIPGEMKYGDDPFSLNANVSSGLALNIFSSDTTIAKIVDGSIYIVGVGNCQIHIEQTGSTNYNPANPVVISVSVSKGDQSIEFAPVSSLHFNDRFELPTINSTSGLPIILSSADTSIVRIKNNTVECLGVGNVIITASQPGNALWNAAEPKSWTLEVKKAIQKIEAVASITKSYGDSAFVPTANCTSGLPIQFSVLDTSIARVINGKIEIKGVGLTSIKLEQPGNSLWQVTDTLINFEVKKGTPILTFNEIASVVYGQQSVDLIVNNSASLPIIIVSSDTSVAKVSGNKLIGLKGGTTTITASLPESGLWLATPAISHQFIVSKANQQLVYQIPDTVYITASSLPVKVTSSSGLPVKVTSSNISIAKVVGDSIQLLDKGEVVLTAFQEGDRNYNRVEIQRNLVVKTANKVRLIDNNRYQFYPNPVADILHYSITGSLKIPFNITVSNSIGDVVYSKTVESMRGTIDLSSLLKGSYMLIIRDGERIRTEKIVIK